MKNKLVEVMTYKVSYFWQVLKDLFSIISIDQETYVFEWKNTKNYYGLWYSYGKAITKQGSFAP